MLTLALRSRSVNVARTLNIARCLHFQIGSHCAASMFAVDIHMGKPKGPHKNAAPLVYLGVKRIEGCALHGATRSGRQEQSSLLLLGRPPPRRPAVENSILFPINSRNGPQKTRPYLFIGGDEEDRTLGLAPCRGPTVRQARNSAQALFRVRPHPVGRDFDLLSSTNKDKGTAKNAAPLSLLVEMKRIELSTFALRTRRSPS